MIYLGDIAPGGIITRGFNTHDGLGAPITIAGSPTLEAYKDDGTTQDTSGLTLTVGFDGVTGSHLIEIDTSADGTFFSTGHDFNVRLAGTATVDGQDVVGTWLAHFSIGNRKNVAVSDIEDALEAYFETVTHALPGQENPTATPTYEEILTYLYKTWRNKLVETPTGIALYDNSGTVIDQKATVTNVGGTYTRGEIGTGP